MEEGIKGGKKNDKLDNRDEGEFMRKRWRKKRGKNRGIKKGGEEKLYGGVKGRKR